MGPSVLESEGFAVSLFCGGFDDSGIPGSKVSGGTVDEGLVHGTSDVPADQDTAGSVVLGGTVDGGTTKWEVSGCTEDEGLAHGAPGVSAEEAKRWQAWRFLSSWVPTSRVGDEPIHWLIWFWVAGSLGIF